ncbi:hypothetical protein L2E82_26821 [Cichorium intybus]|uniref:Uncharacterized protein n=1 Tax=Cichorium intybus TaxID=13427 RepID=A0ACB9CRA1_CICIN|nr:hypothetical protein L2E82_26821 [Cichorium intybus]
MSSIPMGGTTTIKIIRRSIHTFLQSYNYFTISSLLALPFSLSVLLSSSLSPDFISLQHTIHFRLRSLFEAAGIPVSSQFFITFNLKLSQTITSAILLLPFTFSFLLITKTSVIQSLNTHNKNPSSNFSRIYNSILQTQLWNSFLIMSANATSFWVLFIAFNCLEKILSSSTSILLFSMVGGIAYSVVIANTMIICNMALVLSGMETRGGFISILKACVMIKRRIPTALSLSLYINITLAGIEALFQFRVASAYANSRTSNPSPLMVLEGFLIAYLYSVIITLDTITGCIFYKSCKIKACKNNLDQEAGRTHGSCLEVKREEDEELY